MRQYARDVKDTPVEHRMDLEQILLSGLPELERHQTVASMRATTARKFECLRLQVEVVEAEDEKPLERPIS